MTRTAGRRLRGARVGLGLVLVALFAAGASAGGEDRPKRIDVEDRGAIDDSPFAKKVRLAKASIDVADVTAAEALETLAKGTGIPIRIDAGAAPKLKQKVTFSFDDVGFDQVLSLLCDFSGVGWTLGDDTVVVGTSRTIPVRRRARAYDVRPLVGGGSVAPLVTAVTAVVRPGTWGERGAGAVEVEDGWLVVRHEEDALDEVELLLNRLLDPRREREHRRPRARRRLDERLDGARLTFDLRRTPLRELIRFLRTVSGVEIVLDPALAAKRDRPITIGAADESLRDVLRRVAADVGGHVGVRAGVVVLTAKLDTTLRVRDVAGLAHDASRFVSDVRDAVGREAWRDVPPPILWNDRLVVVQTDERLAEIDAFLARRRAAAADGATAGEPDAPRKDGDKPRVRVTDRNPGARARYERVLALRKKSVSLELADTPLGEVFARVARETGTKIEIDPSLGEAMKREVSVSLHDLALASALDLLSVAYARARWEPRGDGAYVAPAEKIPAPIDERIYDLRPFEGDPPVRDLLDLVQTYVRPESWGTGDVHVEVFRELLVVRHGAAVHAEIETFLDRLLAREAGRIERGHGQRDVRLYDVRDIGAEKDAEGFISLVEDCRPYRADDWKGHHVDLCRGLLIVDQTADYHAEIERLLASLREALATR